MFSRISFPFPSFRIPATLILFCLLAGVTLCAQDEKQQLPNTDKPLAESAGPDPALAVHTRPMLFNVDVVLVPVTVNDSGNHPVMGLGQQDFSVFEDSVEQPIRYFSDEDAPISLGVLLDVSNSMKEKIDTAREAVLEFFKNSNPEDDFFVISFSDSPAVLADSSKSLSYVQSRLAEAEPSGHTALLDAIYLGVNKMQHARYKRRALLIVSDGGDNHSRYSTREIKHLVEEADVQIYAIGIYSTIFKTTEEWNGQRLLTSISEATGGHTITIRNAADLPAAASTVSHELRSEYVLGYQTQHPNDGKWRKIKVTAHPQNTAQPMEVHAKAGYKAPGD